MILKEIINKSYYGTDNYIDNLEDLKILEQLILFNLEVLKEYKGIIVATNYKDLGLAIKNAKLWLKYFPDCHIIDLIENRGHNFGTADLDNTLFDYCKQNNIEWLCKSSGDTILEVEVLNNKIEESDFYYLNGIGWGGMVKYDFDFDRIIKEDFYPQTNFYFINVSKTDYLNDKDYVNQTYNMIKDNPGYNGKIWEYFDGWSCEDFLKTCIIRNNLSKYHLVSPKNYRNLIKYIFDHQIHDCSHKQIMIENICHLHEGNNIIKL
tara:strand:- start:868 stop:1659 length:792 start_codon:yes stop_codon:yes gene_type:complete